MSRGDVPADLPCTVASHRGRGTTFMRLTVRDIRWRDGHVAELDYELEPKLIAQSAGAPTLNSPV